jgi:co-chaperonin GroES (HSP10)
MKPSRYVSKIQRAVQEVKDDFTLTGSYLLVEKIPQDEVKTKSGLILATGVGGRDQINSISANLPCFVHVLAVGAGYVEDDGSTVPLDTAPSDILLVGQYSVKWLPVYPVDNYEPFSIGVTSEAETQMRFRGYAAYERFALALNRAAETKVPEAERTMFETTDGKQFY